MAATVIGRAEGRYETEEVEFGKVYRWCPECVVIQCACGERLVLTSSTTSCKCGVDHGAVVREELSARRSGSRNLHPWREGTRDLEVTSLHL